MGQSQKRKKIPLAVEAQVLSACRRRCALCFYFERITASNLRGQIAHIDRNRTNHMESNLAYLCLPHHDAYDSKTSQSKQLGQAELRHAKKELLAFIRDSHPTSDDAVSLTLIMQGNRARMSIDEQKLFVKGMLPQLAQAALEGVEQNASGTLTVKVTLEPHLAEVLCKDFSDGTLPTEVAQIRLTATRQARLVFMDGYEPRNRGVPQQQAEEVVRAYDRAAFYDGDREVVPSNAELVLYSKDFGLRKETAYTVLVIAAIDSAGEIQVFGAVKAAHVTTGVLSGRHPLEVLKTFLAVFGVDFTIPGLGSGNLFLGQRTSVPNDILSGAKALEYWWDLNRGRNSEACAIVSNIHKSEIGPFIRVRFVMCYARDRYLQSLKLPAEFLLAAIVPLD